jgi:hypothetical protein
MQVWRSAMRTNAIIVIAGLAVSVTARAQAPAGSEAAAQGAAAQPTPKLPNGHPDLSGFWATAGELGGGGAEGGPALKSLDLTGQKSVLPFTYDDEVSRDKQNPPLRWQNKSLRPVYKAEFAAKQEQAFINADFLDPSYSCQPSGVPRIGAPNEIVMTPTAAIFLYSQRNNYRVVPTDGRGHNKNADAMAMGDSVGHWEGDTLVVDVTNFSPDTWIDKDGSWHDDYLHVTERFTRKGNTLKYEVKVEDPTLFAQPFTPAVPMLILGPAGKHVEEDYPCVERSQQHLVGLERH